MWRLILGAGVALASYYVGREMGRTEPLRREQQQRSRTGPHETPTEQPEQASRPMEPPSGPVH